MQTSIYLTEQDQELLEKLKARYSLNRSGVIRLALDRLYASEAERNERLLAIADEIKSLA